MLRFSHAATGKEPERHAKAYLCIPISLDSVEEITFLTATTEREEDHFCTSLNDGMGRGHTSPESDCLGI